MTSNFSELGLSENLVKAVEDMGWLEPTPIQIEAIPCGLEGRDMLAQAQTGTGKTGTYGSIILDSIDAENGWAKALVLAPTRELALQVTEELEKLAKYTGHKCVPIYGGVSMLKQTQALDRGVDIIIATPGRLVDHLKDDERLLGDVSIIVLDEADRMLDMGFRKDLEFILGNAPEDRQTMLFSATMAENVRDLALKHLYEPKEICVSKDEPVLDLISQRCMFVEKDDKIEMLRYILAKDPMKTIVFCFTKYRVDKVVRKLKMSFRLAGIHGDITQNRREEILRKFREGKIDVLVASDLAARGLDIDNVGRIINLDMPPEPETYVHRIGRTGRAGKQGIALSFVMPEEKRLLREIENTTLIPVERIETPDGEEMESVFSTIKELSHPVISKKNSRKNDVPVAEKEYVLAEINIGKDDGQNKASISQLMRDYTSVPKKSIGDIRPGDRTTVLEVEKKYLKEASEGISNCIINGRTVKMWRVAEVETPIKETVDTFLSDVRRTERPRREYSEGRRQNDDGSWSRPRSNGGRGDFKSRDGGRRRDSEERRSSNYRDSDRRSDDRRSRNDSPRYGERRSSNYRDSDRRSDDRRSRNDSPRYGERRDTSERRPYHRDYDSHSDDRRSHDSNPRYGGYSDRRTRRSDNSERHDNRSYSSGSYGYRSHDSESRYGERRDYRSSGSRNEYGERKGSDHSDRKVRRDYKKY